MSLMSDSLLEKIGNKSRVTDMFPDPVKQEPEDNVLEAAYHGLLGATGNMIHTANDAIAMAGKPRMYTDQEWMEKQSDLSKWISQAGRDLEQAHERNYEPWSANRIVSGVAGVVPYALGLGAAGAAAARTGNYQAIGNTAWQAATRMGLSPRTAEIASQVAPAAVFGPAIKAPESLIEGQGAYDEYIEEAKRNGTYIPNVTEVQARKLADDVARDNMALLMGTGGAEELLLSRVPGGYTAKNIAQKLLGGMGVNAAEEMAQQIFPKAEGGKDWSLTDEDVLEAGLIGAIGGGAMQGAGIGMNWLADRNSGNNEQEPEQNTTVFDTGHGDIDQIVSDAARQYNLSPQLIHKVIQQESSYNPDAVSDAGAQGLMQLMPGTAQGLGVTDSFDPEQNIFGGAKYLRQMLDEFDGDERKALAAYNAGPNNIEAGYAYADEVLGRNVDGTEQTSEGNVITRRAKSGEGETWRKQTGNVSLEGAQEETLEALELLADWFYQKTGKPLMLTAGTNGEHPSNGSTTGHDAGWKIDVNDWGSGAEGTLLGENDGEKGTLTDEFIAYGQSLGLGMNWEGDHIDVSAAGEQWEGEHAGKNFGGLKLGQTTKPRQQGGTSNRQQQKPVDTYDDEVNSIYEKIISGQLDASQSQEVKNFFNGFFDKEGSKLTEQEKKDILDMAQEEWQVNQGLSGEQEAEYVETVQDAIKNKDYKTLAKMLPSQTIQILAQHRNQNEAKGKGQNIPSPKAQNETNAPDRNQEQNLIQPENVIQNQTQAPQQAQPQQVTSSQEQAPVSTAQPQQQANQGTQQEQPEQQTVQPQQGEAQQNIPAQGTPVRQAQDNSAQNQAQPQTTPIQQQPISQQPQAIQNQPTMEQMDAKILQEAYDTGMGAISTDGNERKKQGGGLALTARTAGISLPSGMVDGLRNGNEKAILDAQNIIRSAGVTASALRGEENEGTESTKTESKETSGAKIQDKDTKSEQVEKEEVEGQKTTSQNGVGEVKEEGQSETPSEQAKTSQNKPQEAREAKALSQFKKNATKVVNDYRNDKISYDEADAKKLDKGEAQKVLDAIKTVRDRHIGSSQKALDREVEKANKEEAKYDNDRRGKWKVISEAGNLKVVQPRRYNTKTKRYESYLPYNDEETYTTEEEAWNLAKKLNQQEEEKAQKEKAKTKQTKQEKPTKKQESAEGKAHAKESKPNEETEETAEEYKYYMNARPVSPGSQPKGFTRFDEEDEGGRHGAIYYDRPLTQQEIEDYELTPAEETESMFGDEAENEKDFLEALGISENEAEEVSFGNEFGDTTDEEIEALKKELQKELSKMSANPIFNPKIYTLGLQLGGKYIQKGYRTFKKWLAKMTGDLGENIEPWAPAIWETLKTYPKGQKFDPKQVMACSKLIGSKFERGVTSLDEINADMKKLLKGRYKEFAPMIEASYNGIEKYFNTIKEGENNVNDSTSGLASRTGGRVNQDAVGRNDESGRPRSGSVGESGKATGNAVQQQDSTGVRDGSTIGSGKTGNRGVQAEESKDRADSAGSAELSGSVRDSYAGSVALDDGRKAEDIVSAKERRDNEGNKEVKQKNVAYKAGDLDSIRADLPMLLPEQQEDVQFIENRLLVNGGTGVLLTNGTGTGKTYSGLGMVKRFVNSGKENMLIVVPSEEVAKQWAEAAKKDFGLDVKPLESVKDNGGKGICVTTYANFQQNKELAMRDWDAVIADESHNLMQNKEGEKTGYLNMLRALTMHPREFYERFKLQNRTKKIRSLEDEIDKWQREIQKIKKGSKDGKISSNEDTYRTEKLEEKIRKNESAISDEYFKMNDKWEKVEKELQETDPKERPKVLFLSATPFAYDKCIDYAEGYLFNYSEDDQSRYGSYNAPNPRDEFMIRNFGYRMRYNKLTRPDAQVDNRVMEIQFHDNLVNSGAMHGRQIDIDADYDRGFILVNGGIGVKIDEGFRWLRGQKKYRELEDALNKQFRSKAKKYLLESIKAQAAVPLVREYQKNGKKVVLFHQVMKEKTNVHPFVLKGISARSAEEGEKIRQQWESFKEERPDLVKLNLNDIPSPMETFRKAFGNEALYVDGSQEHKKGRKTAQKLFNDDNSGKDIIICQQDAANAGISLHDTTGKHPRVLINIAMPERPIYAMQIEGRIYRVGNKSNAVFRYLATGTDMEKEIFANTIGTRAETAENLAQGQDARGLHDSFTNLYMETMDGSWVRRKPGHEEEGIGGKEMDFSGKEDVSDWQRAISFYYGQQKKTSKNKAAEGKDYFATPEPIGLKMVQWLGLKDGDSVLEPSAGHGAISRWFSPNTSNTIVEPSGKLAPLAQMVTPEAKVVQGNFEDFNVVNKFDGIAMNPPFGSGGKTAVDHIAKAFRHLRDGGRLVAIIPTGPAADAHFNKWFYGENKNGEQVQDPIKGGVLTADIRLPSVAFNRAGTGVATRIVVIDKQNNAGREQMAYSRGGVSVDLTNVKDINELFERMENMTMPERVTFEYLKEYAKTIVSQSEKPAQNGTVNFEAGSFRHTKTGKMIPNAKLDGRVERDVYEKLASLAKENGGRYEGRYSKSFLFDKGGEKGRDTFIKEAESVLGEIQQPQETKQETPPSNRKYSLDDSDNLGYNESRKYSVGEHMALENNEVQNRVVLSADGSTFEEMELGLPIGDDETVGERSGRRLKEIGSFDKQIGGREGRAAFIRLVPDSSKRIVDDWIARGDTWEDVFQELLYRFNYRIGNYSEKISEKKFIQGALALKGVGYYAAERFGRTVDEQRVGGIFDERVNDNRPRTQEEKGNHQNSIRPTSRSEESGFSYARSMDDLKTEAKEAFPNAKVEEQGNQLVMTMPNGQKVTVTLQESIEANEVELEQARSSHGFTPGATITIEGYAETVGSEGFVVLSQGSREGTGFHEAYHIAEAMAFTKKELADAKRLISANEEERANAYAKWRNERKRYSNFAKLWQKIADMAAKLAGLLGHETKRNLFRKVESGEIYKRQNDQQRNISRKYSASNPEDSFLERAFERFGKSAGVKAGKIIVEERAKDKNDIGLADYIAGSPSRIAEKVKMFRSFFTMGDKAMNLLTKYRSDYARKLEQALDFVKKKEDREALFDILLSGDAEAKEYTREQLINEGASKDVAEAYVRIRRLMNKAYRMVNDAKRRARIHTKRMTQKQIDALKENKFVEIRSEGEAEEDGRKLVSYKEYANWEKTYTVDEETLEMFKKDDAMQVLETEDNGNGNFTVKVRESVPPVNKLTGYIPHFFHDYMIRVKDADGNYVATIGSGKTQKDAIQKADEWLKKNQLEEGQQIFISPKVQDFTQYGMDEGQYAAIMGDTDFDMMMESIAKRNDLTLKEAKDLMDGSVRKKNRHRFFGNLMHRKGVEGYEQDLNWVLRHYFNSASRYAALESEFKPKAISLFERYFGDFAKDHTGLAKYTKDYINDINGNPTALEEAINKTLNKSDIWNKLVVSNFGDRAALQLSSSVSNWTSMLCLGYLNASSALLNFSQAINATAYLGSTTAGGNIFRYGFKRKYSLKEKRVLLETNVMNDIGLDAGSGYDINRGYAGKAFGVLGKISNWGMAFFKASEGAMRRGTVLAAYDKAIKDGKTHAQAIEYAKEINRKSNFDYGVTDAPNIFRRGSIISQLALQFKKYAFKEVEVMGDMLPMLSKSTNRTQKLLFWGWYFLACGLLQVPALDWLDKLLGENLKDFAQKGIMEVCGDSEVGKAIGKTAMYGFLSISGVDISNRAGMADVVPSKPTDVFGPALNKTASLISDMAKGDHAAAIRDVSPGIYNQYAAWLAGESTGTRGRVNSRYDDAYSKILKSIGFKSTDERIASDIQRIYYNDKSKLTKEKQAAVDAYIEDPTNENAKRLKELGVKRDTVDKERERKKADRKERVKAGMNKDEKTRYQDMLKFAE